MRRPLFTTGFPQAIPQVANPLTTPANALSILDLRSANEDVYSRVHALTLYVFHPTASGTQEIEIGVQQSGSATASLVGLYTTGVNDTVVKILDKYPFRGPVNVVIGDMDLAGGPAYVFGYLELENETPELPEIRPFQPTNPVSPFTAVPPVISVGSGATTIHTFDEDYIDVVHLSMFTLELDEFGSLGLAFPNGVSFSLGNTAGTSPTTELLDGIPMRGDGGLVVTATGSVVTVPTGRFYRY